MGTRKTVHWQGGPAVITTDDDRLVVVSDSPAGGGGLTDAELRATPVPVSGPLTDTQLRATAIPVSVASLPLPAGAATAVLQSSAATSLANLDTGLGATNAAAATTDAGDFSLIALFKRLLQKTPSTGTASASNSQPVVLANHVVLTGNASQTAGNNLIASDNTGAGTGTASDTSAYQSGAVEIVSTATGGTWIAEQSINGSSWVPCVLYEQGVIAGAAINAAVTASASTRAFAFSNPLPLFRLRAATTLTGGSVQARAVFSQVPFANPVQSVVQSAAANLNCTATINGNPVLGAGTNTVGQVRIAADTGQGSSTSLRRLLTADTNLVSVKASAGVVGHLSVYNDSATKFYLKLYNKTSAPVLASDTPEMTIPVPAGSHVPVNCGPFGLRFATGIALAVTRGIADTDTTAVTANDGVICMRYT